MNLQVKQVISVFCLILWLALPASVWPQAQSEKKAEDNPVVSPKDFKGRIFELKHREPGSLLDVLRPLGSGAAGTVITANNQLRIISVRDYPENIAVIEEAIKRLDKPQTASPKVDLEVHLSLIAASRVPGATSSEIPPAISKVLEQLRNTLQFKSYRYITTFVNRTSEGGSVESSGAADAFFQVAETKGHRTIYNYGLTNIDLITTEGGGQSIRIPRFKFGARVPVVVNNQVQYQDVGLNTQLTLKDGEQVVVGTSNVGSSDEALIVVVSVKRVP